MIVYISIGNSDDKLTQSRWADFQACVWQLIHIRRDAVIVHGEWMSSPTARFQNACWCVEFTIDGSAADLKRSLRHLAGQFDQDSIAWAVASETEFLGVEASR